MTLKLIKKGDVICDYHGCLVDEKDASSYAARTGRDMSYIIENTTEIKRLVDASNEDCPGHPRKLCLGRLCNPSRLRTKLCTARFVEIVCRKLPQKPRKSGIGCTERPPAFHTSSFRLRWSCSMENVQLMTKNLKFLFIIYCILQLMKNFEFKFEFYKYCYHAKQQHNPRLP